MVVVQTSCSVGADCQPTVFQVGAGVDGMIETGCAVETL